MLYALIGAMARQRASSSRRPPVHRSIRPVGSPSTLRLVMSEIAYMVRTAARRMVRRPT